MVRACRLIGRALKHNDFDTLLHMVRPFEDMRDNSVAVFAHILTDAEQLDPNNVLTDSSSSVSSSSTSSYSSSGC